MLCGVFGHAANADRLMLRDGKTLDGEIVAEDEKTVTVELFIPPSYTIDRRVAKTQVSEWQRASREGAPYVLIPFFGEIGTDVTVEGLRAGLQKAREARPQFVVLAIDSPGGNIAQMVEMIDLLTDASKEFKVVAYVKEAYSAAAVVAMTCPQVLMRPGSTIGATVPFRITANGPQDVEAKFRSVIEARMRAAVAQGGHADLLIRGMSEMNLELFLTEVDGKPVLQTSGPGKIIKSKGQILTLTADEAVRCGLAAGVSADMTELGRQAAGGAWHESTRRPWNTVLATDGMRKEQLREVAQRQAQSLARQSALARVKPELDAIQRRIAAMNTHAVAAQDAIAKLTAKRDAELKQIKADYQKTLRAIAVQGDSSAAGAAQEEYNSRSAAARDRFQAAVASLQSDGDADARELKQLRDRQQELLASVPQD